MRRGYLQQLDASGLADWAHERKTAIRMLVRPGDYVFPGAPIAVMTPPREGAEAAIRDATALGPQRASSDDLEFAVRQLVEVAVRALSPGINDPHTAISVLDRLGAALCDLQPLFLGSGVHLRDQRPVLVVPAVTYDGLVDAMFLMIRQNAAGSAAVLIRLLEVSDFRRELRTKSRKVRRLNTACRSGPWGRGAERRQPCRSRRYPQTARSLRTRTSSNASPLIGGASSLLETP